jgi:hypothetical protein
MKPVMTAPPRFDGRIQPSQSGRNGRTNRCRLLGGGSTRCTLNRLPIFPINRGSIQAGSASNFALSTGSTQKGTGRTCLRNRASMTSGGEVVTTLNGINTATCCLYPRPRFNGPSVSSVATEVNFAWATVGERRRPTLVGTFARHAVGKVVS